METKDNLLGVIATLFKWKKIIIATCAATAIGAAIISLILPVYYKSTTIFYAASPDLAVPAAIFGISAEAPDYYGTENDIDRILSIANSGQLVAFMVDSFDLYKRYDIDPKSLRGPYYVALEFESHFDVVKTKYDAIELSIEDEDKEMAARMANAARSFINDTAQRLIKESQAKTVRTFEENIKQKEADMKMMNDSMQRIRLRYGVYNTKAQSENLSELIATGETKLNQSRARMSSLRNAGYKQRDTLTLLQANITGYEAQLQQLYIRLDTFNRGMALMDYLVESQLQASEQLAEDKEHYKMSKAAFGSEFPAIFLLEEGQVPVIKSRPKRALMVIAATAVAFIFSVIGVLIFDTYRDVNWREILSTKPEA
jgi:tyrosine-protein kinase Etk/Wzc